MEATTAAAAAAAALTADGLLNSSVVVPYVADVDV